jgi:uncharacterized protein (DUF1778 family)
MQTKKVKPRKTAKPGGVRVAKNARAVKSMTPNSVRFEMRIDPRSKTLIERAAVITGQTLTDYAVSILVESAMTVIERHERLVMTDRDRDRFLAALDRPAKPLPELKRAAKIHARLTRGE